MGSYEKSRALHAGEVWLSTLQALNAYCFRTGLYLFRCRPKNHYFKHILMTLRTSQFNPKNWVTTRKESMLFKLKRIGKRCSSYVHMKRGGAFGKSLLQKHWMHMESRFRIRKRNNKFHITAAKRFSSFERSLM